MNILIVEDDSYKYSKIAALLGEHYPSAKLLHKDSVRGAVLHIRESTPNLLILDMSLPSHSLVAGEGSPVSMPAGGIEILMELKMLYKTDIPIIVVTQYPDVEIEDEYYSIADSKHVIAELYGIKSIAVIHYDNDSFEWIDKFKDSLTLL